MLRKRILLKGHIINYKHIFLSYYSIRLYLIYMLYHKNRDGRKKKIFKTKIILKAHDKRCGKKASWRVELRPKACGKLATKGACSNKRLVARASSDKGIVAKGASRQHGS